MKTQLEGLDKIEEYVFVTSQLDLSKDFFFFFLL